MLHVLVEILIPPILHLMRMQNIKTSVLHTIRTIEKNKNPLMQDYGFHRTAPEPVNYSTIDFINYGYNDTGDAIESKKDYSYDNLKPHQESRKKSPLKIRPEPIAYQFNDPDHDSIYQRGTVKKRSYSSNDTNPDNKN